MSKIELQCCETPKDTRGIFCFYYLPLETPKQLKPWLLHALMDDEWVAECQTSLVAVRERREEGTEEVPIQGQIHSKSCYTALLRSTFHLLSIGTAPGEKPGWRSTERKIIACSTKIHSSSHHQIITESQKQLTPQ